jgi:hypothetical protein
VKNQAAVELGKLGGKASGKIKSKKKAAASRRNGKKGGRPKAREADPAERPTTGERSGLKHRP